MGKRMSRRHVVVTSARETCRVVTPENALVDILATPSYPKEHLQWSREKKYFRLQVACEIDTEVGSRNSPPSFETPEPQDRSLAIQTVIGVPVVGLEPREFTRIPDPKPGRC